MRQDTKGNNIGNQVLSCRLPGNFSKRQSDNAAGGYLFDKAGGGPQQPKALPAHVKDLGFDSYRSLAWIVREHHGYMKNDAPFSEFKWANFFRTQILLDQDILAGKHTFDDFAFEVDENGDISLGPLFDFPDLADLTAPRRSDLGTEGQREQIEQAEKSLEWAKSLFVENGIACNTHLLIRGLAPGEDIVEFAEESKIDEIVIGVRRRSKVGKLIFGSNAQYIILMAQCPVVAVK